MNHSNVGIYLIDNQVIYYGTESGYLQILIEFGIFGFILIFGIILTPVIQGIQSFFRKKDFNIVVLIASLLSWMIAWATVNSISDKRVLVVVATILCLLIVSNTKSKNIHV